MGTQPAHLNQAGVRCDAVGNCKQSNAILVSHHLCIFECLSYTYRDYGIHPFTFKVAHGVYNLFLS